MKRIWTGVTVIVLVAITFSCEEDIDTPQFPKSNEGITVSASETSVAPAPTDSLADVVTLTWNDPKYSVGLNNSKFTVRAGAAGENFSRVVTKEFVGVLEGGLMGKDLNGMALTLGGVIGEPITLDVMLVASHITNNEPKNSNVLQIEVTPYGDLALTPSSTDVVTSSATSGDEALELTWSPAFIGFDGAKTYQLQYAAGGTDFAAATTVDVSSLSYSFSHFDLNQIALGLADGDGPVPVDFRIKAVNQFGTVVYSNIATVNVTTYIAYVSIGIIGSATPGGWDVDSDLYRPDLTKPTEFAGTFYLIGGSEAKFRSDDKWDRNWGSATFPSGTGTQNGANIPITNSGYYKVTLNVATGAYTFTPVTSTVYTYVSLIGDQTDWGSDIADLTKDPGNNQIWTGTVALTAGELKFRANHDWGTNWGATSAATATALSGYGVNNGSNMVIPADGTYFVYINVATGEYFFGNSDRATPYNDIGVIGNATPGGWDADTNIIKNPSNPYKWSGTLTLTAGEAKFRANNDWGVNWGAATFPGGTGVANGPNIPVTAGTYFITFNSSTGEYYFLK